MVVYYCTVMAFVAKQIAIAEEEWLYCMTNKWLLI